MKFKILIAVLLVIIAVSVLYLYQSRDLILALKAPEEILIGVPFDLKVEFSNKSGSVLKDAVLTINLPDGAVFVGKETGQRVENKNLGNIGEDSLISETYQIAFLSGKDSRQKIKAVVGYSPGNLGARFETDEEVEVAVRDFGVKVEMVGPSQVFGGEEFDLEVVYRNVSEIDFRDLELKMEYPPSFTFLSSSIKPDKGRNTWFLGDLRKGSEGTFSVRGSAIGPSDSSVEFRAVLKTSLAGRSYELEVAPAVLKIAPSPLALTVLVNNKNDFIARPGDSLEYIISYINGTDAALRQAVIRAQLVGEMFDLNYLNSDGFFRAADNTLIWNAQNTPSLNLINQNSAGFVRFSVKVKERYPIQRFSDKNFLLRVNAEIESPTVPSSATASRTYNLTKLETKVSGNIKIEAKGLFRDAASGILNKGPMPPRVGQPTNFTIHWLLQNFAADVSGAEVRATLPPGAIFSGMTKTSFGPEPFYDKESNQMVWQAGRVSANRGVVDQPLEAIFQIAATPDSSQIGNYMTLLGETTVKAVDEFSGLELTNVSPAVTTALPDDLTIGSQGGVVQP